MAFKMAFKLPEQRLGADGLRPWFDFIANCFIKLFKPIAFLIVVVVGFNYVVTLSESERTGLILLAFVGWFLLDHRETVAQKRHDEILKAIADRKVDLDSTQLSGTGAAPRRPLPDPALLGQIISGLQRPAPPARQMPEVGDVRVPGARR